MNSPISVKEESVTFVQVKFETKNRLEI